MASRWLAVLCVALAVGFCAAEEDAVFTVTGDNFEKLIKDNDFVAVEFYAPWCGHCKKLAPEWEAAAKELKEAAKAPTIVLAKLDATEEGNKELATKYGIKGFPTIKIFRDNDSEKPTDYEGPRERKGILTYLKKQAGPPSTLLADASAAKEFRTFDDEKDTVIVAVIPGGEDSADFKAYAAAAQGLRSDYEFAHATDAALVPEAKDANGATIVLLKQDSEPTTYSGAFEAADISKWVEKTAAPAIITLDQNPRNRKALQKVFSNDKPKLLGFIAKGDDALKAFKDALIEISGTNDDISTIFAESDGNKGAMDFFGLKSGDLPAVVIHDQREGDAKYASKNADPAKLSAWVADFLAGKLERTIKSEEEPDSNDGPVKVLTAKSFDEHVFGKPRNVFIEFYAPWCGHCKKLAPVWEEVGKEFADDDTVVIAKLDATANDIPDTKKFKVSGFPTLKLVTADGKVVDYKGDRSKDDLIKFLKSNADSKAPDAKDEL